MLYFRTVPSLPVPGVVYAAAGLTGASERKRTRTAADADLSDRDTAQTVAKAILAVAEAG